MSELPDPRSLEALRRDQEIPAPEDARARVASRLGVTGRSPTPPRSGTSISAARAGGHIAPLLAATFVAGGAVGALLHAGLAQRHVERVVYVDRPVPTAPIPPSSTSTTSAPSATDSRSVASSNPGSYGASPPLGRVSQLDAERSLLDAARVALVGGDTDTALRALERHARTYGHPILGEERDALFVQGLVRAGRYDEARARAEAFRHKAPNSLLLPAVDAAIASIP